MLRRVTAIALLALMGAGFYLWSGAKKDAADCFISLLDELSAQTEEQNWQKAEQIVLVLESEYEKRQRLVNMLTNHDLTDKLYFGIAQLKTSIENKDLKAVRILVTDLKAEIKNSYESSLLKPENIL